MVQKHWKMYLFPCANSSIHLFKNTEIASPGSMCETGCSGLVHWGDPGGWDAEGGRRGVLDGEHVCLWLIHVDLWQKPLQYCKVISLQLK